MKNSILYSYKTLAVVAVLGIGSYVMIQRNSAKTKSSREFFQENPHLGLPRYRVQPEPEPLRADDQFKDGDFQLKKGQNYSAEFITEYKANMNGKSPVSNLFKGTVKIRSFGIVEGRLKAIVEFYYTEIKGVEGLVPQMKHELGMPLTKTEKAKLKSNIPQINQLLLVLEPRGVLREVYATGEKLNAEALETKIKLVDSIFRKIHPIQVGTRIQTESDETGLPFQVKYQITLKDSQLLSIEANAEEPVKKLSPKEREAQMATMGIAGFKDPILNIAQDQRLKWLWHSAQQRPVSQFNTGTYDIKYAGRLIASVGAQNLLKWAAEPAPFDAKPDELGRFKFPVDFKSVRGSMRKKSSLDFGGEKGRKSLTFEESIRELKNVDRENYGDDKREDVLTNLSLAFKYNPHLVARAADLSRGSGPNSQAKSILLGALGYDMSPIAQKALTDIFNKPTTTPEEKEKILTHFVLAGEPLTEQSKDFLAQKFKEGKPVENQVAGIAGFALGASIQHDGDPRVINIFKEAWEKSAPNQDTKAYLLSAMGNSKSNAFIAEVKEAYNSDSTELKQRSADAVRFAQDQQSRDLLFDRMIKDRNRDVRASAYESLQYQPFDERTKAALTDCSVSDKDTGVKMTCYRILGYRVDMPGVREFLSSRINSEQNEQIRAAINSSLSSDPPKAGK